MAHGAGPPHWPCLRLSAFYRNGTKTRNYNSRVGLGVCLGLPCGGITLFGRDNSKEWPRYALLPKTTTEPSSWGFVCATDGVSLTSTLTWGWRGGLTPPPALV